MLTIEHILQYPLSNSLRQTVYWGEWLGYTAAIQHSVAQFILLAEMTFKLRMIDICNIWQFSCTTYFNCSRTNNH